MLPLLRPLLLTLFFSWCAILFGKAYSILPFTLLMMAIALQVALLWHTRVQDHLLTLRKIGLQRNFEWKVVKNIHVAYFLSLVPATALFFPWTAIGFFALASVYYLPKAIQLGESLLRKRQNLEKLKSEYIANEVRIVVHIAGPKGAGYVINQWLPVLEKSASRPVILLRNSLIADEINKTTLDVYFAKSPLDVECLLSNGPSIVLYPANFVQNLHVLRHHTLEHLFINHGESDKDVNQSKLLMAYDLILVAGPIAEKRLRDAGLPVRPDQVMHVGRPQAELLLQSRLEPTSRIERILYAPTWEGFVEGVNYSSLSNFGVDLLEQLTSLDSLEVWFKPHPFSGTRSSATKQSLKKMKEVCRSKRVRVLDANDSLFDAMNWSDLLISDISSVMNDYLITRKPIVLCNVRGHDMELMDRQYPSSKAAYLLNEGNKILALISAVNQVDAKASTREVVRKQSLGDFEEPSIDRFLSIINQPAKSPSRPTSHVAK